MTVNSHRKCNMTFVEHLGWSPVVEALSRSVVQLQWIGVGRTGWGQGVGNLVCEAHSRTSRTSPAGRAQMSWSPAHGVDYSGRELPRQAWTSPASGHSPGRTCTPRQSRPRSSFPTTQQNRFLPPFPPTFFSFSLPRPGESVAVVGCGTPAPSPRTTRTAAHEPYRQPPESEDPVRDIEGRYCMWICSVFKYVSPALDLEVQESAYSGIQSQKACIAR